MCKLTVLDAWIYNRQQPSECASCLTCGVYMRKVVVIQGSADSDIIRHIGRKTVTQWLIVHHSMSICKSWHQTLNPSLEQFQVCCGQWVPQASLGLLSTQCNSNINCPAWLWRKEPINIHFWSECNKPSTWRTSVYNESALGARIVVERALTFAPALEQCFCFSRNAG